MKLTLNAIRIVNKNRIEYDYTISKELFKYFSSQKYFTEYDVDITTVPESILVIPFLVNVLPISWFLGFDIFVDIVDEEFITSVENVKKTFKIYHPQLEQTVSNLHINNPIKHTLSSSSSKNAMLFSGGVDAYTTFFRHCDEQLDLITIKGADMSVSDNIQWNDVVKYNAETAAINNNKKFYITSNVREFITFEVDKILQHLGWWGKVQHGLSLTGVTAPLSYLKNYKIIYIASSYTRKDNYDFIIWGSMPEIDNNIKWANTNIVHDAAELTRQEKIEYIVQFDRENDKPILRVCYSDYKNELNCSICEKCLRTIIALMISGADPKNYGFEVNYAVFDKLEKIIKKGFATKGNRLFWKEIYEAGCVSTEWFEANDPKWQDSYDTFFQKLKEKLDLPVKQTNPLGKLKFTIINTFPRVFKIYLKLRRI